MPSWFEGGQMPLQRRLPKFGFKNPNRIAYRVLNVGQLNALVESGKINASDPVTVDSLVAAGLIRKNARVKILGQGELSVALNLEVHAFSRSAEEKIHAVGGSIQHVPAHS